MRILYNYIGFIVGLTLGIWMGMRHVTIQRDVQDEARRQAEAKHAFVEIGGGAKVIFPTEPTKIPVGVQEKSLYQTGLPIIIGDLAELYIWDGLTIHENGKFVGVVGDGGVASKSLTGAN
jgi:hypothetical protein